MATKPDPPDFVLTKYGYDRTHELELNKFTHALEMEQLRLLILLNGGGAVALVTLASHRAIEASIWFSIAIFCWLFGLAAGADATIEMRDAQSGFAKSLRHRRCATEWRRFGIENPNGDFNGVLGLPEKRLRDELGELEALKLNKSYRPVDEADETFTIEQGASLNDRAAELVFKRAVAANSMIFSLSVASLGLFGAGALAAMAMVYWAPGGIEAQSNVTQNSAAPR